MKAADQQQSDPTGVKSDGRTTPVGTGRFPRLVALAFICALLTVLSSCAALLDGKFVPRDGKETPFKPLHNPYEPPRDPTAR